MMSCLIVEDDATSRAVLAGILADVADCDFATDGEQALQLLLEGEKRYDLVFVDIMLPKVDGHRVIRELRAQEAKANVQPDNAQKVIVASALENSENVIAAYSHGCTAYVTKPFERNALLGELERLGLIPSESIALPIPSTTSSSS